MKGMIAALMMAISPIAAAHAQDGYPQQAKAYTDSLATKDRAVIAARRAIEADPTQEGCMGKSIETCVATLSQSMFVSVNSMLPGASLERLDKAISVRGTERTAYVYVMPATTAPNKQTMDGSSFTMLDKVAIIEKGGKVVMVMTGLDSAYGANAAWAGDNAEHASYRWAQAVLGDCAGTEQAFLNWYEAPFKQGGYDNAASYEWSQKQEKGFCGVKVMPSRGAAYAVTLNGSYSRFGSSFSRDLIFTTQD